MEKETLYKYFSGLASDAEKEAIKNWLEEDQANHQILLNERKFYDALLLADDSMFVQHSAPRFINIKKWMGMGVKWAAAVIIAFLASYTYFVSQVENYMDTAMNTVTVPYGQRVNLSLSDGTKVCLNAGTVFTYPSAFGKNTRNVELNGEAFFEVSSNKERPFIVHTQDCDVQVLGTKFNVNAYKGEHNFTAALMEGRIRVQNNLNPKEVINIMPDMQVALEHGKLKVDEIPDYDVYRWRDGLVCFKELDFMQLLRKVEKYFGVNIKICSTTIRNHSFSGKFRISDGIDYILRVLQRDVKFTYERSEDGNTIYIK